MNLTQQITSKSDFFYKKKELPIIKVGDKVKVLNYLDNNYKNSNTYIKNF